MSLWVKVLLLGVMGVFALLALIFFAQGETKAAAGACMPVILLAPALLEIWRPGKYVLRKPAEGIPDNVFARLKQFRLDHPGIDGTLILGFLLALMLAMLVGSLVSLARSFSLL